MFNKTKTAIVLYPIGKESKEYIVPDFVTSIGDYAFNDCAYIESIVIPVSVISIGEMSLDCENLKTVKYFGSKDQWNNITIGDCNDILTSANFIFNYKICSHMDTEVIPGTPASCSEKGLSDGKKCSVCEVVIEAQKEIPAKGHTPSNWIVETAAKVGINGIEVKKCTSCGVKLEEREIPALKEEPTTEALTTEETTIKKEESTTKQEEPTSKKDEPTTEKPQETTTETLNEPVSDIPEEPSSEPNVTEPIFMLGDINGDGNVTATDARLILRLSAKLEKLEDYPNAMQIADANGDGKITAVDARKVLRVSARLEQF